jgi:hypothetical protein
MGFDLRLPIGLLFAVFGVILAIDGLVAHRLVLDINVNLWGASMTCSAPDARLPRGKGRRRFDRLPTWPRGRIGATQGKIERFVDESLPAS